MLIGQHLFYKLLKDNKPQVLLRLKLDWLELTEKKTYNNIMTYLKKYSTLPKITKKSEPEDFENHPFDYYIDELYNRYLKRKLMDLKENLDTSNPREALKLIFSDLSTEVVQGYTNENALLTSDDLYDFTKAIITQVRNQNLNTGLFGYPTGFDRIDSFTGGYVKGDVCVYVARPKTGKTTYMLQSLLNLVSRFKIQFISMEMPLIEVQMKMAAMEQHTPISNFLSGRISSFAEKEILDKLKTYSDNLILTRGDLINSVVDLYPLIETYKPDIVFIDGAYLLKSNHRYNSEWEKAKYIVEEIKTMAMKFDKPFVCSYQINRSGKKSADLENIAFSDAIGQIAGVIISVEKSGDSGRALKVIGNRRGVEGVTVPMNFDWLTMDFNELYQEEDSNVQSI